MITRRQVTIAIMQRDAVADEIRNFARHLPFDKALQVCGEDLKQRYLLANRVACFLEQQVIDVGQAYRTRTGNLIWRVRKRA